jgi:hypothetical protein
VIFDVALDFSFGRCTLVLDHLGDRVECSARRFLFGFAAGLRRVRALQVDHTGHLEQWGWEFPDLEYLRFMRLAQDAGARPLSLTELRDVPPGRREVR